MGRHHLSEPRVRAVVDRLVTLFLQFGSVNAIAETLSAVSEDPADRIYANRIHGLLSDDPTRSVNTATLESMEERTSSVITDDVSINADASQIVARIERELVASLDSEDDALIRVADALSVPRAVVRWVASGSDTAPLGGRGAHRAQPPGERQPDWTWQDVAVEKSIASLRQGPMARAGLIVPTGGGKTRIAVRVIGQWLAEGGPDDRVLWVTHRKGLRRQARREWLRYLRDSPEIFDEAKLSARTEFVLVNGLEDAIERLGERVSLVVVDEAHHVAARSYAPLQELQVPGLYLTATPNRADALSIGIDEIAFTITYRELFERGCVIEPAFDPPTDFYVDWRSDAGVKELADYLLDRSEHDFRKTLVAVTRRESAESLYSALVDLLPDRRSHPLEPDDIGFVHGAYASVPAVEPADFLDEFSQKPRGVLVATSSLVGEGFDDPLIDTVVITYASSSISHLMQVAGRGLRWAPGKDSARIVQVRESSMEYHFEQRWLYEDISDRLRPELVDRRYRTLEDLEVEVANLLGRHNVAKAVQRRILRECAQVEIGRPVHLMFTGLPYFGPLEQFEDHARWGAILSSTSDAQDGLVHVFNDVSARDSDLKEPESLLRRHIAIDSSPGSTWKSYQDLIFAMEHARREICREDFSDSTKRPYRRGHSTTFLRYVTLTHDPALPHQLDVFLGDTVNRHELEASYVERPNHWKAAVKVDLPLGWAVGLLLDHEQRQWVVRERNELVGLLRRAEPVDGFRVIDGWEGGLPEAPVPMRFVREFGQILRPEEFDRAFLSLETSVPDQGSED